LFAFSSEQMIYYGDIQEGELTMNVSIPADLESFVQNLVLSGSYPGPDEVVGKALQMLKRHEELRREIQVVSDQFDRGEFTEYDERSFQRFNDDIKAIVQSPLPISPNSIRTANSTNTSE